MYVDTDVVLACLKPRDWLTSEVDIAAIESPRTSVATTIEVQYVMEDEWDRERLGNTPAAITGEGIELLDLTTDDVRHAGMLRERYARVGVFDSIHLGAAWAREEPIVSTDTLYPSIAEVEHLDPRDIV